MCISVGEPSVSHLNNLCRRMRGGHVCMRPRMQDLRLPSGRRSPWQACSPCLWQSEQQLHQTLDDGKHPGKSQRHIPLAGADTSDMMSFLVDTGPFAHIWVFASVHLMICNAFYIHSCRMDSIS